VPLQGRNLWMVSLGTVADVPPIKLQPPLRDSVHPRWTFDPALGVPWYGYYLLRRKASEKQTRLCLSGRLKGHGPGTWPDPTLAVGFSEVSSDLPLVFTEHFPPAGVSGLDLFVRAQLTLTLTASGGHPGSQNQPKRNAVDESARNESGHRKVTVGASASCLARTCGGCRPQRLRGCRLTK
jgi:hypothetical protein